MCVENHNIKFVKYKNIKYNIKFVKNVFNTLQSFEKHEKKILLRRHEIPNV